jgi:hypothetical protein
MSMINIKKIELNTRGILIKEVQKDMNSCVHTLREQSSFQDLDHKQKTLLRKFVLFLSAKQMLDSVSI